MSRPYSQARALWAITRASFKAIFNQPISVVFSLLFPIIFILIFGAFGKGGMTSFRIAISAGSDTINPVYERLKTHPAIRIQHFTDSVSLYKELNKGRLTGIVTIDKQATTDSVGKDRYTIGVESTSASSNTFGGLWQILDYIKLKEEMNIAGVKGEYITIEPPKITNVKQYKQIDFVLPGQVGFSILFSTLFGIAFTFYTLREQLVLKRFYASPVRKIHILLGIGMSRLFFQLMNVIVLVLFGHFLLDFTLQNGVLTVIDMIVMSIIMLFLLMGVGLIFSSIVKSDATIPLLINLFGFPQMLLSGTFFPIEVFPKWLQSICQALPLTQFNNAIRKISFEGQSIIECWKEIGILGIWMFITYVILIRVIKWE